MKITLRQLEIFTSVAKHQHVTKASEEIYLSQSAVSMAINELETVLKGELFYRSGKKLVLNDRGRLLYEKALKILDDVKEVELTFSDEITELSGILKIGASSTIGNYLLPEIIGKFLKVHDKVKITLEVANTSQIADSLRKNNIDLGFVEGNVIDNDLSVIKWFKDQLIVFTNNHDKKRKILKKYELNQIKWIGREKGSGTREIFEKAITKHLSEINYVLELGNSEAIKKAVESDLGIACLSRLTIEKELKQKFFMEIKAPFLKLERDLSILLVKNSYKSKLIKSFIVYCENYSK